MDYIGTYAKAVSAAVVAALTTAVTALNDNDLTAIEGVAIASAFLVGAGAVWAVPNTPESVRKYGKAITSALVAALASVAVALTDGGGIGAPEWLTIVIALLGGLGLVAVVPNAAVSDRDLEFPDDEEDGPVPPLPNDGDLPRIPEGGVA
jgi:peptidoglycan/LPS O-acetylase OafA/YrhL